MCLVPYLQFPEVFHARSLGGSEQSGVPVSPTLWLSKAPSGEERKRHEQVYRQIRTAPERNPQRFRPAGLPWTPVVKPRKRNERVPVGPRDRLEGLQRTRRRRQP